MKNVPSDTTFQKYAEVLGYLGMLLIHGATLPTAIAVILGYSDNLPPLDMVLMLQIGLFMFLIRAIARNDTLYIISNGFGFFMQTILLSLIIF